ncbi:2-hydroxychromene-2-carboxylate isomerase [Amycolatopsis aidingensis]|uniref:2-hydroxychromene-2-carboxylate isomerase n=1 Tax=Amycolatopsis aidingensis TaxID=2842453 RepID=UPI001C0E2832|nr:DsbA family protein [Amycolatopsis aidingensis]
MASRAGWRPRMYFSLRSPYSWLALHDLHTRHADLLDVLEWRPAWDPDPESEALLIRAGGRYLYTPMSREKHLYALRDVRRLASARGLRVVWPVDRSPRWEVSHLAYLVAEGAGRGEGFATAVCRARWEEGRDISDPAVVAEIGETLGLDGARLAGAAEDPALVEAGTDSLMAMYRDGVFGVPFFVHGGEQFWGIDRLEMFVEHVRSLGVAGVQRNADAVGAEVAMAAGDDGHAGGCG